MGNAVEVARAVLDELGERTDSYKLQKLVYYCQAWHTTQTKRPLFDGAVQAWENGPVAVDLWPKHKGHYWVTPDMLDTDSAGATLDDYEMAVIRAVVAHYGGMPTQSLIELTHSEAPWKQSFGSGRNSTIAPESMRAYYGSLLATSSPTPDLPGAGVHYVTAPEFATLMAEAEDASVNVVLAAALLRARAGA